MKPIPNKKLFTKRHWKLCVKALSCLVVFCTVYVLILPAITLEAKSYCQKPEHKHKDDCYLEILQCSSQEHEHDDFCFDETGNPICPYEEHVHDQSCYERILDCGQEEHEHELICFSNPEADLDKPENWEPQIDQIKADNPDLTRREMIAKIAQSQEGQKESLDNYIVQDETVKKGISRYGIWDDDPYEDWSGAFARFVLSYAGFEDKLTTYPKATEQWLEQLYDEEKLLPVLDGKQGDVLFTYNDKDELKAGIITDNNDDRITAIMGDWQDKVSRQTFQMDDASLHSIFKITPDDPDKNQQVDKEESRDQSSVDNTDSNLDTDPDEDQSSRFENSENNPAGPTDFSEPDEKADSSSNDTSDDERSKDDNYKWSQSSQNSDDSINKTTNRVDLNDTSKDSSDTEESDKTDKKDPSDKSSSTDKSDPSDKQDSSTKTDAAQDDSKSSLEDSKSDSEDSSKDSSQDHDISDSEENNKDESGQDEIENGEEADSKDIYIDKKETGESQSETVADDGTVIQAQWDPGTFDEDQVVFQAKVKETDPKIEKQLLESLQAENADEYQTVTYDLSFFRRNENAELEQIEPKGSVLVTWGFTEDVNHVDSIYHYPSSKRLEKMKLKKVSDPNGSKLQSTDSKPALGKKSKLNSSPALKAEDDAKLKTDQRTDSELEVQSGPVSAPAAMSTANESTPNRSDLKKTKKTGSESKLSDLISNPDVQVVCFETDSFSDYIVVRQAAQMTRDANGESFNSMWQLNQKYHNEGKRYFKLTQDVGADGDPTDWNKFIKFNKGDEVTIDLNGHSWSIREYIEVSDGTKLNIINTHPLSQHQGNINTAWDHYNGTTRIKYQDKEGIDCWAEGGGVITGNGLLLRVYGKNNGSLSDETKVTVSGGVGFVSTDSRAIKGESRGLIELNESYVCSSKGGIQLHFGAQLTLNQGSVISLNNPGAGNRGGGIYCEDNREGNITDNNNWFGTLLVMNAGSLISSNEAASGGGISIGRVNANIPLSANNQDQELARSCKFIMNSGVIAGNHSNLYEGGGLALQNNSGSRAILYGGEIYRNSVTTDDWGGGGVFAALGNYLWMPNGASIYDNAAKGLGGGLTGCATGKLIIDPLLKIFQNTADGTNLGKESDKPKIYNFSNRGPGYYLANSDGSVATGYKGEDLLGADITQVDGRFATDDGNSLNAHWEGNVDKHRTVDEDGTTLNSSDWMALKCTLDDSITDNFKQNKLIIHGNTSSTNAGGVLINGWLVTGNIETTYLGKSLALQGFKSLQDSHGDVTQMTNGEFKFKVTEENDQNAPAISRGTNNGDGEVIFDSKIPVGEESKTQYTFYVMEDLSSLPAGISSGGEVYEIQVNVSDQTTTTVYMPVWNEERQAYEAKQITVVERKIDQIQYRKSPDGNWISPGSNETVTIGSKEQPSFTNRQTDKTSITVKKKWEGSTDNPDSITVALKKKGQTEPLRSAVLNAQNQWQITWSDLETAESDGTRIEYSVEELDVPEGYISSISGPVQIDEVAGTAQEAYVPYYGAIQNEGEYLIIDSSSNRGLSNNGTSMNSVDVSSFCIEGTPDAYHINAANSLTTWKANTKYEMKDTTGAVQGIITALEAKGQKIYLAGASDGTGLRLMKNDGNDSYWKSSDKGFGIRNIDGNLIYDPVNTRQSVVYQNGQFGTANYLTQGTPVKLYVKGTVNVGHRDPGAEYTITNTKISNTLKLTKTDDSSDPALVKKLAGAKFELKTGNSADSPVVSFTENGNGSYAFAQTSNSSTTATLVTNADGEFTVTGLPKGKFYLFEVEAPQGYEIDDSKLPMEIEFLNSSSATETLSKTVINKLLIYELPETGGAGTEVIQTTGSILLAGASIAITQIYRKKRNDKIGKAGEH